MHLDGQELWRWPFQKRKGWVPGEDQKRLGLTDNEVIFRGLPKGKGVPSGHRHTGVIPHDTVSYLTDKYSPAGLLS